MSDGASVTDCRYRNGGITINAKKLGSLLKYCAVRVTSALGDKAECR